MGLHSKVNMREVAIGGALRWGPLDVLVLQKGTCRLNCEF